MDKSTLEQLSNALVSILQSDRIIPHDVLTEIGNILDPGSDRACEYLLEVWNTKSLARADKGKPALDPAHPLNLSRGYGDVVPEDELSRYLPEEKILINKDSFRKKLDKVDFSALDAGKEKVLIEALHRESIGLSKEDVILYYNLIKINRLTGTKQGHVASQTTVVSDYPETILKLFETQFDLTQAGWSKINAGKAPDRQALKFIIEDNIRKNRWNPAIIANYLGMKNDKYMHSLKDFLKLMCTQRGEDHTELLLQTGVYLLLAGSPAANLEPLKLSPPLISFVTDKIGRVRTIYYASILFMHNLLYVLFAQIYELSYKYYEVDEDQQKKLQKLYSSDDRLAMLLSNATNVGMRKIADYKSETREIQNMFKKFTSAKKDFLTAADLFRTNYR